MSFTKEIKDTMLKRKMELLKLEKETEKNLQDAPEGTLRISRSRGRTQYYLRKRPVDKGGTYISKDNIYPAYREADVVVLASPLYYWFISGVLKNAFDRLFAIAECDPDYRNPRKQSVLIMAAEGAGFEESEHWYDHLEKHIGFMVKKRHWKKNVCCMSNARWSPAEISRE